MPPQAQETARFKIQGEEVTLVQVDDLEFGEVEMIEDAFDRSVDEIDFGRVKALRYLVWFSLKRAGKDISLEDVGQIKLSEFAEAKNGKRPTKAAAKGD